MTITKNNFDFRQYSCYCTLRSLRQPGNPLYNKDVDAQRRYDFVNTSIRQDNIIGWKDRIRRGVDCTTWLEGTRFNYRLTSGRLWAKVPYRSNTLEPVYTMNGRILQGTFDFTIGLCSPSVVSTATAIAQQNFAKQVRKRTRAWQGGVFTGEILQTAKMLASPGKVMFKEIFRLHKNLQNTLKKQKQFRRGGVPRYVKALKNNAQHSSSAIASTYLEWKFGVEPLIQDLDDAGKAFRKLASGRQFDTIRVSAGGYADGRVGSDLIPLSNVAGFSYYGIGSHSTRRETYDESEVTYKGAWKADNPSSEMPVPMTFGVSIQDIVPTAWELVPWSFFVDYFTSVGDTLDAWQMRFVSFAWLNRTTRSSRKVSYSDVIVPPTPANGTIYLGSGGHARGRRDVVSRVPVSGSSFNSGFTLRIPKYGSTKWVNIVALAALRTKPSRFR